MKRVPLRPLLAQARDQLATSGIESPAFDAEELMASVLGIRRGMLFMTDDLTQIQADAFHNLVARRARREPLQHITGLAGFRSLELRVGKGVFIPRFETELVAGAAIDACKELTGPTVVDLCSGSGAIALAVANEAADAEVFAVERDAAAIYWLLINAARRAALGDRPIEVVQADIAGVLSRLDARVDVVVSNPPYVPASRRASLQAEVAVHDPEVALFGGADGLQVITTVVETAARLLKPDGQLIVEHDDSHFAAMAELLSGWEQVTHHTDLAGRPRYTTARLAGDRPFGRMEL